MLVAGVFLVVLPQMLTRTEETFLWKENHFWGGFSSAEFIYTDGGVTEDIVGMEISDQFPVCLEWLGSLANNQVTVRQVEGGREKAC